MSIIERSLLFVVLIISVSTGVFLLAHIPISSNFIDINKPPIVEEVTNLNLEITDPFSSAISKLSMIPESNKGRKIVSVVIENHENARPFHKGLEDALMIQEHMVEGLISRFIALYDLKDLPDTVGPVRSLRPYFIDSVLPLTNIFIHAGGSPDAIRRIEGDLSLFNLDGIYLDDDMRDDSEFFRLPGIPAPHDLFTGKSSVEDLLPEETSETVWPPYKIGGAPNGSGASVIRVNFFNIDHNVRFEFKRTSGKYKRTNGWVLSKAQPRNIIIMEMPVNGEGEYGRLDIDPFGEGAAIFFRSGRVYHGRWIRDSEEEWFRFESGDGNEFVFAQGMAWVMGVPGLERVSWE